MKITFLHGFSINEMAFGSYKKELYRLPSKIKGRFYPFKKLSKIKVNGQMGYRCYRKFLSLAQINFMSKKINRDFYYEKGTLIF